MPAGLIAIVTFVLVAVIVLAIVLSFGQDEKEKVLRTRMAAVRRAEKRGDISLDLKLVRDEMLSTVPTLNRLLMRMQWSGKLQDYLNQSGLKIRAAKLLLTAAILGVLAYMITGFFFSPFPLPILAGIVVALAPIGYVAWKHHSRLQAFEERFPEALDLLGRAVRAGHAFTTGLEMVGKESPEPVAGEFRTAFEEQNFGLPLRDALVNLAERIPIVDVQFFVTALLVQKETGGNLAEILDELARVIRDRFRIYREVQVKTAQGRLTAGILILLPVTMLIALKFLNPQYVNILFTDPIGPLILTGAGVLQLIGAILLWRIVQIQV
jgi:tight adherence protein B